jgi:hypothetical protein
MSPARRAANDEEPAGSIRRAGIGAGIGIGDVVHRCEEAGLLPFDRVSLPRPHK